MQKRKVSYLSYLPFPPESRAYNVLVLVAQKQNQIDQNIELTLLLFSNKIFRLAFKETSIILIRKIPRKRKLLVTGFDFFYAVYLIIQQMLLFLTFSLTKMTNSNRMLSLELLDFITEWQVRTLCYYGNHVLQ